MRVLLFGLIFVHFYGYGQDTFTLKPKTISQIKDFEKSLGSQIIGFRFFNPKYDLNYQKNIDVMDSVLIFKRTNDNFYPGLHTWYFYDKDSLVNLIYYHWGFYNTAFNFKEHPGLLEKQTKRYKEYSKKFNVIKKSVERLVKKKGKKINDNEYRWEIDSSIILLLMRFDKKLRENPGGLGKSGDYKIELRIYFTSKEIAGDTF
ncbi:MAG TPA: hypothetical protein VIN08_15190 [Ohtaekwangia sp.]|uniref:hypothetical protein n=1 Tax=Ohtaekwangia sp. TaxID=2066019 RepID=UPI002F9410F4